MKPCVIATIGAIAACVGMNGAVRAQSVAVFPNKPVRVVIAQSAGGATDILTRLFAAKMSEKLGQQFIVDNRGGGGAAGVAVSSMVAKANPDGYTLLVIVPSFTFAPALHKSYPVDPIKDFAPVSLLTRSPYLLVVNASTQLKSVKELIGFAQAQPGKLNFGAGNSGTGTHLITVWFFSAANIKATYIPYKNLAPAILDIMGGRIDAVLANVVISGPHVKSGKLRALGISLAERSKVLPDIPTIAEQGVPGYNASSFHGYVAPARTPAAIINKLSMEFAAIAKSAEIVDNISSDGGEPIGSTPEQLRQFIAAEVPRWRKVVKDAGIQLE
jgi:tripartite-type tricarboxylate transporter receptor subunit TctC